MRIKKLELAGFKSFKDRTVIHFDKGITGIVGPNGCGKSNIVDALVWVMGEMSAKHLRGSSMLDVIFAGAESYAPMGMAEVSLTLENNGGPFPSQYLDRSEIMITRRLHRSGETEYLINKEPSRLRDIQEIFMDTGAGAKGFSIIEQGRIGEIITKKPMDRRTLIEEVAGITKFKFRKRESQRKLSLTEQNLVRLQDIISEQKRQLNSLERQAQRANLYRKIKNELQEKDIWLSAKKYMDCKESLNEQKIEFDKATESEVTSDSFINQLESEVQNTKFKVSETQLQLETAQLDHQKKQRVTAEKENSVREFGFEIEQARRNKEMAVSVVDQQVSRKEALNVEKEEIKNKLIQVEQKALEIETQLKDAEEKHQLFTQSMDEAGQILSTKTQEVQRASEEHTHAKAELKSLIPQEQEKTNRFTDIKKYLEKSQATYDGCLKKHKTVLNQLETEKQFQLDLMNDFENFQQNLKSLTDQKQKGEEELSSLKDRLNKVSSRLYGLEDLQCNYEGFEEGVKSIMLWQEKDLSLGFKPLAEVVEVSSDYEMAMEVALGAKLQLLLSESDSKAIKAIDYLRQNKSGRSSFITKACFDKKDHSQILSQKGVEALLSDGVSIPAKYQDQLSGLLDNVVIVSSIEVGLDLKNKYPEYSFVTFQGDALSSDGVLSGGSKEHIESGLLKRRREIKELSLEKKEIARALVLIEVNLKKIIVQFKRASEDAENAQKKRSEKQIQIAEFNKDVERVESEMTVAQQLLNKQVAEVEGIDSSLFVLRARIVELNEIVKTSLLQKNQQEDEVIHLQQQFEQSRTQLEDLRGTVTRLQIENAAKRQEVSGFKHQLEMVNRSLSDVEEEISQMFETSLSNSETMTDTQIQLDETKNELSRLIREAQVALQSVSEFKDNYEVLQASLSEKQEKVNELYSQKNEKQTWINEVQLKIEQLKMQEQYLIDQVREKYMKELSEVSQEIQSQQRDAKETEKEVGELRSKLGKIGEVNLSAIEEYDGLVERYEFLKGQHEDLLAARDQLCKVINRINRICSVKFKDTFEQINDRFKKVFPNLFGGGEAKLILVEDAEKDEVGVDIIAQPPGKKMQNVTLLSGGEKALTAVALIFSIFLIKPSPFCLLDEVDAPLDDANVFRFNELVQEMAKRSQIIVVTHNKYTMRTNNKIFGVTMEEKGVSKMVSVDLDQERTPSQPELSV